MKATVRNLSVALLIFASTIVAAAPERVQWDKRPIAVHIQQGQERIIHFPDEVRYWLPDSIQHKVSVLAANGVLYIRALETFPSTRIRVQSLHDQQVYLLDITSSHADTVSDTLIVMTQDSTRNLSRDSEGSMVTDDWRVRLTRYAARQLYAPARLSGGDPAIKRVPLAITSPIPLIRGNLIEAIPIASWRAHDLTVTAFKLRNTTHQSYRLQFENVDSPNTLAIHALIRGRWQTATLQHHTLGPSGQETDTTTLYLVSDRSLPESLHGYIPRSAIAGEADDGG